MDTKNQAQSKSQAEAESRDGVDRSVALPNGGHTLRVKRKVRHFYDRAARYGIAIGGVGVIAIMLVIFVFLIAEVQPLFSSASVDAGPSFQIADSLEGPGLHLAIDEQARLLLRISARGRAVFLDLDSGAVISEISLAIPEGYVINQFALDSEESGVFAYSLSNGSVHIAQYLWETEFSSEGNLPVITPLIVYPYGQEAVLNLGSAIDAIAVRVAQEDLVLAAIDDSGNLKLLHSVGQRNLFSGFNVNYVAPPASLEEIDVKLEQADQLFIGGDKRLLYAVSDSGRVVVYDLKNMLDSKAVAVFSEAQLVQADAQMESIKFLSGGLSLLVADSLGFVSQWFVVRDEGRTDLEIVRRFAGDGTVVIATAVEQRRKNFVALSESGLLSLHNVTSQKRVLTDTSFNSKPLAVAVAPRGNKIVAELEGGVFISWSVDNPHPEVSFAALWRQVWYESYPEPDYVWQPSAASNDFEPKYSLVPLSFGTLKAAFYAMLIAAPLAICGAIYTGYFMAPVLRRKVKPLIELMEALPTVVLGFLAGLWLAPFVESNLPGVIILLLLLPLGILLFSFSWAQMPKFIRYLVPEGWEAILLIPFILLFTWGCFHFSYPVETFFFAGDMQQWLSSELGISYDQRNAMVVGFAMGFAVIPTVYSIAEDAIFTVPRHLSDGSLALGATSWQSLYHVVLPMASPGIFSALMIGLGRAVGETMIILMATGNTPIMDINIFEGMRTLAASIAIEVPESEVSSTHYRILFLAATVLFLFTFVVNTVAEVVRQQLRGKYSSL
ncbi:MAG: phosphate transport system permease protein [Pseudohongiellaceae bacterium]|jgi:phosphate transport system permease protein